MSDTPQRRRKRSTREIDISTNRSAPSLGWRGNVIIYVSVFGLAAVIFVVNAHWELPIWVGFAAVVAAPLLGLAISAAWILFKHGTVTWMRIAKAPAKAMALGDAEAAQAAFARAMARAKQFTDDDPRRGVMLGELAMFVKNQGRSSEAIALYEESIEILVQHHVKRPMDYFVALNNYAICFIHLRDYDAAQRILEKVFDLSLAMKKRDGASVMTVPVQQIQAFQFVLHLNLAFLFIEMRELAEAEPHLAAAESLLPMLTRGFRKAFGDHYFAVCALWEYESGHFADAESEIAKARNADYPGCLRIRANLHRVRQEFVKAEELLRKLQAVERKKGTLHRPELLNATLDLAESLFGQVKHDDAFAEVKEARSLVADFALPTDAAWRRTLQAWLKRARDLGKADVVASLEEELHRMPVASEQAITILDKFRLEPRGAE